MRLVRFNFIHRVSKMTVYNTMHQGKRYLTSPRSCKYRTRIRLSTEDQASFDCCCEEVFDAEDELDDDEEEEAEEVVGSLPVLRIFCLAAPACDNSNGTLSRVSTLVTNKTYKAIAQREAIKM